MESEVGKGRTMNNLFSFEETPSRLDKVGSALMNNPSEVTGLEAFELLADMLDVDEDDLFDFLHGKRFIPNDRRVTNDAV